MDSEAGPHGPGSPAAWVPGNAHARLQQEFGVVRLQAGIADVRISLNHEIGVVEIVGAPAKRFIPPVGHLVPQPQTQSKIPKQLDFILDIPGCFERSVSKPRRIPRHDRLRRHVLQKCQHARIGHVACR